MAVDDTGNLDHSLLLGKLTPGLRRTITKHGVRAICKCGMILPRYVGAYPKKCPLCGRDISASSITVGGGVSPGPSSGGGAVSMGVAGSAPAD